MGDGEKGRVAQIIITSESQEEEGRNRSKKTANEPRASTTHTPASFTSHTNPLLPIPSHATPTTFSLTSSTSFSAPPYTLCSALSRSSSGFAIGRRRDVRHAGG